MIAVPRLAGLWFGVLGGLAAWTAHLILAFVVISIGCAEGRDPVGAEPTIGATFVALTTVLAVVAGVAMLSAFRIWRDEVGWRRFMGFFGVLLDALALGTIVLGGTQLLVLCPCA
ncbi:MAG: hypothetical protein HY553_02625 [Elusimicrobia bacterium]|nr:hypothetical protein [Elusimicrobiota bacterium]